MRQRVEHRLDFFVHVPILEDHGQTVQFWSCIAHSLQHNSQNDVLCKITCCRDGQKAGRRGTDGLMMSPHTHYERRVDVRGWLHPRGRDCAGVRGEIERKMKIIAKVPLHDYESCSCDRGKIGEEKRKEANRKRKLFYESEAGKTMKEKYKKKKIAKEEIIKKISELFRGLNKAELKRIGLNRLISMI